MSFNRNMPSTNACELVLPLSHSSRLPYAWSHPVASHVFLLVLSPLICFLISVCYKAVPTQSVTNPVSLPSFYFVYDVPFFPWLCVILFLVYTRLVQMIFSILYSTFLNFQGISYLLCQVSQFQRYRKLCSKWRISLVPYLNFCSVCWRKDSSTSLLLVTHCIASYVRTTHE